MSRTFHGNWVTQVRKGLLELSVLNALSGAKRYGYDIVKTLRTGNGLVMTEGTIYPILEPISARGSGPGSDGAVS